MNDTEFQKLLDAEPPLVLRAGLVSNWALFLVFATALGFVLAAELRYPPSSTRAWGGLIVFGGTLLFGTLYYLRIILFPGSFLLILEAQGFTIKQLSKIESYPWKDVSDFAVGYRSRFGQMYGRAESGLAVYFKADPKYNKYTVDLDDMLPDTYGLSAQRLASLMNHWRERAIAAK